MTRQWLRYIILAIVFYLVFLIVTAPAVWAAWALVRFTHGVVSLNEPEGTIWYGRGDLVVHAVSTPPQRLGAIRWSIDPLWFFAGKIGAHIIVSGSGAGVDGGLRVGYRRVALSDFTANFPAQLAASLYSPLTLIGPSGNIRVSCKDMLLDPAGAHGAVTVQWQGAGSSLSSVRPLGDYRLYFEGKGQSAGIKLETVDGDLALNGEGTWQIASGQVQFNGTAKPNGHAPELEPLLRLFGPDAGGGRRNLLLNTRIGYP